MQSTSNITHQTCLFIKEPDSANEVGLQFYILVFHNLNHHSGSQFEAILKDQTVSYCLELTDAIRVFLKQLVLLVCHGSPEFFFVPTDQLQ